MSNRPAPLVLMKRGVDSGAYSHQLAKTPSQMTLRAKTRARRDLRQGQSVFFDEPRRMFDTEARHIGVRRLSHRLAEHAGKMEHVIESAKSRYFFD